jgi:hypothetical protein
MMTGHAIHAVIKLMSSSKLGISIWLSYHKGLLSVVCMIHLFLTMLEIILLFVHDVFALLDSDPIPVMLVLVYVITLDCLS